MAKIYRTLLAIAAVIFGLMSLVILFWWGIFAFNTLTGHTLLDSMALYSPHILETISPSQEAIMLAKAYFCTIGGAFGWLALIRLCVFANQPFGKIPQWVLFGMVIGVIAALLMPVGSFAMALPPILLGVSVLVRSRIAA